MLKRPRLLVWPATSSQQIRHNPEDVFHLKSLTSELSGPRPRTLAGKELRRSAGPLERGVGRHAAVTRSIVPSGAYVSSVGLKAVYQLPRPTKGGAVAAVDFVRRYTGPVPNDPTYPRGRKESVVPTEQVASRNVRPRAQRPRLLPRRARLGTSPFYRLGSQVWRNIVVEDREIARVLLLLLLVSSVPRTSPPSPRTLAPCPQQGQEASPALGGTRSARCSHQTTAPQRRDRSGPRWLLPRHRRTSTGQQIHRPPVDPLSQRHGRVLAAPHPPGASTIPRHRPHGSTRTSSSFGTHAADRSS
jgi:hypothetical protein